MRIKGFYLLARLVPAQNPLLINENVEFLVDYVNDCTDLSKFAFWNSLGRDKQKEICLAMTLRGNCGNHYIYTVADLKS